MADMPVRLEHRAGSDLKITDHSSRNPSKCSEASCQICSFVSEEVAASNNFKNILTISTNFTEDAPFLQLKTWKHIQANDQTHMQLTNLIRTGQLPQKKKTGGEETTLKHLFTLFTKKQLKIDVSGVIMIKSKDRYFDGYSISVPSNVFPGLIFAFHNKASHPTKSQMFKLTSRYYFFTGMISIIEKVTQLCLQCLSTAKLPKELMEDSTTIPIGIGTSFCSDVLERLQQKIMVTKEGLTHFTAAVILLDQTSETLWQGLVQTIAPLISPNGGSVRLDSAPSFQSIAANQEND